MEKSQAKIVYAFLADSHKKNKNKIDATGIFNEIGVYATPAQRKCSVIFCLRDIPIINTVTTVWIQYEDHTPKNLLTGDFGTKSPIPALSIPEELSLRIESIGMNKIGIVLGETLSSPIQYWIPLNVVKLPWPELPKGPELQNLLKKTNISKAARVILTCNNCKNEYIFQANLDPSAPLPKNARSFPPEGVFKCPVCKTVHPTRDNEGQVRAQIGRDIKKGE